jgi:predicted nucleic acid-binding protein
VITAIDTNVLLDVLTAHPDFGPASRSAFRTCRAEGSVIACEVVWAEMAGNFSDNDDAQEALARLEVSYSRLNEEAAFEAARTWREYRRRGGPRKRIVSDFLIGSHALLQADRLLTRDRGFYRSYFRGLEILDPSRS